jgi:hypothetical protein
VSLCEGLSNVDGRNAPLGLYRHCVIDPVQERVKATVNQDITLSTMSFVLILSLQLEVRLNLKSQITTYLLELE